ncbi:MAG: hypothetical protein A3F10_00560 [Coxiella sp. RIFCSPHIGHO2_12_FULL_42_15]|nr:MAG: hypothetical protein A3F10_00560 [Coxiella sp. RIFCSPHIGHO2_12_FULL_42_15]
MKTADDNDWEEKIKLQCESHLSKAAFCRENQINYSKFNYWVKRLKHPKEILIPVWINYYGKYYKSALYPVFQHLNRQLTWWAMKKYKKFKGHQRRATHWLGKIAVSV